METHSNDDFAYDLITKPSNFEEIPPYFEIKKEEDTYTHTYELVYHYQNGEYPVAHVVYDKNSWFESGTKRPSSYKLHDKSLSDLYTNLSDKDFKILTHCKCVGKKHRVYATKDKVLKLYSVKNTKSNLNIDIVSC